MGPSWVVCSGENGVGSRDALDEGDRTNPILDPGDFAA